MTKYFLDPDYRKAPPKDKPYCIRCQKPIKNLATAVKVTVVDEWFVVEGGSSLLGTDCWRKVKNGNS